MRVKYHVKKSNRCTFMVLALLTLIALIITISTWRICFKAELIQKVTFKRTRYKQNEVLNQQQHRQKLLKNYCLKLYGGQQELNQIKEMFLKSFRYINRQITYDDKAKLIYCSVAKVASTNWKRIFHTLRGRFQHPLDNDGGKIHENLPYFWKLEPEEKLKRLKTYLSFMFTRHPFERVVSAYRNKLVYPGNDTHIQLKYGSAILRKYRAGLTEDQYHVGKGVTFKEFVRYLINENKDGRRALMNPHWRPANSLCTPCLVNYTFLGKMSTMDEDSEFIMRFITHETDLTFQLPKKRRYASHSNGLVKNYYKDIPKAMMSKLYEVYKDDFEAFGYSPVGYQHF